MTDDLNDAERRIVRLFGEAAPAAAASAATVHAIRNGHGVVVLGDNASITVSVFATCPGCRLAAPTPAAEP